MAADSRTRVTRSPEETQAIGRRFAAELRPSTCVALTGDLGSGKTCLVQGICAGLRVRDRVTSPTFVLINEYEGCLESGDALPIYHFDLYRLTGPEELYDLGCDDFFYGRGICLIEWADHGADAIPPDAVRIHLEAAGPTDRSLTFIYPE